MRGAERSTSAQSSDSERWGQRVVEREAGAGHQEWGTGRADPGRRTEGYTHSRHSLSESELGQGPGTDRPGGWQDRGAQSGGSTDKGAGDGEKALASVGTLVHTAWAG